MCYVIKKVKTKQTQTKSKKKKTDKKQRKKRETNAFLSVVNSAHPPLCEHIDCVSLYNEVIFGVHYINSQPTATTPLPHPNGGGK